MRFIFAIFDGEQYVKGFFTEWEAKDARGFGQHVRRLQENYFGKSMWVRI